MSISNKEFMSKFQGDKDTLSKPVFNDKEYKELKNQIQRKEWIQETVNAFADINAECEAERKEEEEFQQSLRKPKH